jgi:bisphosphoglycerate-independent phosphoglycerate mutase (AlkP superfamily)
MIDIAPTILALFGIATPAYMEGRSLLRPAEEAEHAPA